MITAVANSVHDTQFYDLVMHAMNKINIKMWLSV